MVRPLLVVFFVAVVGLLLAGTSDGLQIVDQQVQLKTGSMLGSVGVKIAQWDVEFDEDLYYWVAPPCAPGLTRAGLTAADVAANPCWAGCDFTSSDPALCGQPFNKDEPSCQALCDNFPKKAEFCDTTNKQWLVIEPDVESPLLNLSYSDRIYLRFNWLNVEQGFRNELVVLLGQLSSGAIALMDPASSVSTGYYCSGFNSPDPFGNTCPSFQCFYYGTWEIDVSTSVEQTIDDYRASGTMIVRSFTTESGPRRTAPLPDAPPTLPLQVTPLHTPLQFGVTQDVFFPPDVALRFYQLTTTYCGLIAVQHEKAQWVRPTARVALGLSTDGNPFPVDVFKDILFIDESIKSIWVCPKQPDTPVVVFFVVARYRAADEPPLSYPELHYLTIDYYRPEGVDWRQYRLGSGMGQTQYSQQTPFPPLSNWGTGLAANTMRLSCPDPAAPTTDRVFFDCRAGSSFFGTCLDFLFALPGDPWPVPLLPVPNVIRNVNPEGFGNIVIPVDYQVAPRKLTAFLILETSLDGSVFSQSLGPDWPALWPQCVLHIGGDAGPLATINGSFLQADLLLPPSEPTCVYDEFVALSEQITQRIEAMTNSFNAYSERVYIDQLTFDEPWQGCNLFVSKQLSNADYSAVSIFDSVACADPSAVTDPCCNTDLSWTQCCAPRTLDYNASVLTTNENATQQICSHPTCIDPLLADYSFAVLNEQIGGCLGPDLSDRLRAPIRTYRDCREQAFGPDYTLPSCLTDADCTSRPFNPGQRCDLITNQCVFDFDASLNYFFQCLVDNLPIEARIKLVELNGYPTDSSAQELTALLTQTYAHGSQCILGDYGSPWSTSNLRLVSGSIFSNCAICRKTATDLSTQVPPWCDLRTNSLCSYGWGTIRQDLRTCGLSSCNWDPTPSCDTSLVGTSFCGVCETSSSCLELAGVGSQDACAAAPPLCFLADGTVRTDLSADACAATFTCSIACNGGPCTTQQACEAAGMCETEEEIYEAIANTPWATGSPIGFCSVPLPPYDTPDCSVVYLGSMPSSYGCVVYGDCTGVTNQLNCTSNYGTEASCRQLSPQAVWHTRYANPDACNADSACNEPLKGLRSLSSLGSVLRTPKDSQQCQLCGAERVPIASWQSGRWLAGVSRPARWLQRALVNSSYVGPSIDFTLLYNDIYTSSRASVSFQLENNIQCSYQTINNAVRKVVCDCSTELGREQCFPGGFLSKVGNGEACPASSNTIYAPPARLYYDTNSVSGQLENKCVEFQIVRLDVRLFFGQAPPPISTGFVPTVTVRGWDSVVNENGALVGQVVGDGVLLKFDQAGRYLTNIAVCLQIADIPIDASQPFSVYSLGYWRNDRDPATVVPYRKLRNVTVENGFVCAELSLPGTGEDVSFVPIYRRADWESQPSPRFSQGQLALIYIVASFYAILAFAITVQIVRLLVVGAFHFAVATNYMWVLLFFMTVIRSVYLYLLAANVLGQQNNHLLVDFWMIDLPTLLWLIVNSIIAISFSFLVLGSKYEAFQKKQYFWIAITLLVCFIVAIFVAILLAFNYAVVDTQGASGPALCSTYTDNSDAARTIRIIYEALLFFIALSIAVLSGIMALALSWSLRDQDGATSLLYTGATSSYGILSDSLAFLIYYIVNNPTPYFAIVLIFTEILPIAFIVYRVSTKQIENQQQSNQLGTRGSGRTSIFGGSGSRTPSGSSSRSREALGL